MLTGINLLFNIAKNESYSDKWSEITKIKYIVEYNSNEIYNSAIEFKQVVILEGCKLALITIFDRKLQDYSKYIYFQGVGEMRGLCGNWGVNYYYNQSLLSD